MREAEGEQKERLPLQSCFGVSAFKTYFARGMSRLTLSNMALR